MVVIYLIDTKFKRTGFVLKSFVSFIILSSVSTLFVTLSFGFNHRILPISLCLPFIDPTNSVVMIKIFTWIFIITQTATSIVIMGVYILLVKRLKETQKNLGKSSQD